jgi:acyl-CoA thioester hydrolase
MLAKSIADLESANLFSRRSRKLPPLDLEMTIPVRTYDIDAAGHVSNIVYIRWLEDMRLELFNKHFSFKSLVDGGSTLVLKSTYIEYKRSISLFDVVTARMWVDSIAKASLELHAEFYANGLLTTTARHVGVFVDLKNLKPRRVPEEVMQKFDSALS